MMKQYNDFKYVPSQNQFIKVLVLLCCSLLLAFLIITSLSAASIRTPGRKVNSVTNITKERNENTVTNIMKVREKNTLSNINTGKEGNTESNNYISRNGQNVCLTKGCVKAAAKILELVDDNADPCEDFERFACGSYLDNIFIPDGHQQLSEISVELEMLQVVRKLLEEDITDEDNDGTKIMKTYYNTCMDTDRIEKRGLAPLQDILAKLGGWPVVEGDKWDSATYRWTHNLYKNRELGYSPDRFFNLHIHAEDKNSSLRFLHISQADTYIQWNQRNSDIQVNLEYQLGVGMAKLLGADIKRAERELEEVINLDGQIAKIILHSTLLQIIRHPTASHTKTKLSVLQRLVPDSPWLEYINTMVSPFLSVNSSDPIVDYDTDSLKKMSALINKTPMRILANYIIWDVVRTSVPFLNKAALDLQFEYDSKKSSRWRTCATSVRSEIAVGALYIRKYFQEDAKYVTEDMVKYIHEAFNNKLRSLDWLDHTTMKLALQKSESMHFNISYPEVLLNNSKMNEFYDGLFISKGDYLEQKLNWTKYDQQKKLQKFRNKLDMINWEAVTNVDAHYNLISNTIGLSAGILQGIFFDAERPMYLNFGGIGSVIGHEISHGFDVEGKTYDGNGDKHNWWNSETERKYMEKTQCIIEQYGNFTVIPEIDLNVNGMLTISENIADNGGIKDAYYGYKKWVKDHGKEPSIPGLTYTSNQLFWISSAHQYCSKPTPDYLLLQILFGTHTPDRFRINGPRMNNVDFSKDFNCPLGSPMNPKNKCEVL